MSYPTHRFKALVRLSASEERVMTSLGEGEVLRRKGEIIQREGDPSGGFHLLCEGWVSSSVLLRSGQRLVQKVHLPGDMLSTPSMALPNAADTLTALTEARTSFVPLHKLGELFVTAPRLAALFTIAVQVERLALMDTLAVTGNASAQEQVARFLLDIHARLSAIGAVQDDAFDLPITQEVIGDLLGLTAVHVNRTLRTLEDRNLISRKLHRVKLVDVPALRYLSPMPRRQLTFEPEWLPVPR